MRERPNPVLWLVIALPLLAVAGSLASLAVAVTRGDGELPKNYHWEGAALESDQQRQALAARLGISATVEYQATLRRCALTLHGAAPAALRLTLTHPTEPGYDRRLLLRRQGERYLAPCAPLPAAHWWLELSDDQGQWLLRARVAGKLQPAVSLGGGTPRPPESP